MKMSEAHGLSSVMLPIIPQTTMRMALAPSLAYIVFPPGGDDLNKGKLLSAFSLGYLSTQMAGGHVADRLGPRRVITAAMLLGAVALGACSLASSPDHLFYAHVVLGMAQGPLFPCANAHLAGWLPPVERAFAATLLDSGNSVGSFVAMGASGALAAALGWRATFVAYSFMSVAMALLWQLFSSESMAPPSPSPPPRKATAEAALSNVNKGDVQTDHLSTSGSIANLLSHASVWSIFLAHFAFNFGVYFQNSWTPQFYGDEFKIRPEEAGLHFVLPHVANLSVKLFIAKPLMARLAASFSLGTCRKAFTCTGFIGSAASLGMLLVLRAPAGADGEAVGALARMRATTACFTACMAFVALHPSGFKTSYMDVTRHRSGALSGVGNTIASAASYIGPICVGRLLDMHTVPSGGWQPAFIMVIAINFVAAVSYGLAATADCLD